MKSLILFFSLLFVISTNTNAQIANEIKRAYEIINRAIVALGGREYLKTINTLYTETKTEMKGQQVLWVIKEMLPNKGALQITQDGKILYQNWFDGKKGFEITNGKKKKQNSDSFKNKLYRQNIFDELDYVDSSLWKISLIGEDNVEGDSCYKIKATLVNGLVEHLYFSKTSFLLRKIENILNNEKDRFSTYIFDSYKSFGKLTFYTEMKMGEKGKKFQIGYIVKLLINEIVEEQDFH